ncbi:hypothetical protein BCR41DRAFT_374962 [Lobosporangium transversale]|uniref:Galactose oxidase n=1 Tax=Lobosporangium transversale TaxID=64571 RepID=A0A1Y2GCR3_9FUNG|nr:hypothetical protein BCR41DRAFT_374962 [Lobosporangium transversale]ORZ04307.1 hypothetical protein BCR41DRAFT_374962 [Lobosporangium transversale]|eukprot:XP_021876465.1 hypothetical protein BCR41DRAFT_374962 [Lobosporangium transversale]
MMKLPFAITIPTRPCMGSTIVLANDSAIYCFGGRLENRELTRYHYVSDVETCLWETIHAAPSPENPTDTNSGSISGVASLCPRPRYFYALNAFGTSLVLFRGVGKIVGNEADETKQQNGNNNRSETTIEDQTDESHWDFAI